MARVYGLELFQNVRYAVVTDDAGDSGIEIQVDERSWGPSYLQAGMHYASSSAADAIFTLAVSYLRTGINERGGEARATISLGDEPGVLADFYQPLATKGAFFFESELSWQSTVSYLFAGSHVATSFDIRDQGLELAAGRVMRSAAEIRAGFRAGTGDYQLRVGDPLLLPESDYRRGEVFLRFSVDTLDSVAFPRMGSAAAFEWRSSSNGRLCRCGFRAGLVARDCREDVATQYAARNTALRRDDQRFSTGIPRVSNGWISRSFRFDSERTVCPERGSRGFELFPRSRKFRAVSGFCGDQPRAGQCVE